MNNENDVKKESQIIKNKFSYVFSDSRGMYIAQKAKARELPKITINAETLPAAYELALISVWNHGVLSRTHYDQKDQETGEYLFPPSREASVVVNVSNPFKEPRIHMFIPGNYESLESYRQEVVEGIRDSWIDPSDTKWTYTYSERLRNWNPSRDLRAKDRGLLLPKGVNQIEKVVDDLERDITSKGAQMTIWMPTADPGLESNRPCLQRIWFRAYEEDGLIGLNANWYFRSRDFKAWFMNFWALSDLHRHVADMLSKRLKKSVDVERESDISDSLHFYGDFHKEFEDRLKRIETDENFQNNVVRTDRHETLQEQFFQDSIKAERERLEKNPHYNLSSQRELAEKIARDPHASERDKQFVREHFSDLLPKKRDSWWSSHNHFMENGIK